jgi:hypothetical protein
VYSLTHEARDVAAVVELARRLGAWCLISTGRLPAAKVEPCKGSTSTKENIPAHGLERQKYGGLGLD